MIRDSIAEQEQEREREQGQGRDSERRARTAASISRCVPLRWGPVGKGASGRWQCCSLLEGARGRQSDYGSTVFATKFGWVRFLVVCSLRRIWLG